MKQSNLMATVAIMINLCLTGLVTSAQQGSSVKPNANNGPHGISISKLLGLWQSVDTFNYKIEFSTFNSEFVLINLDTPFYYLKDLVYNIPARSSPLVPFYFSSDSSDIINSIGYFPGQPEVNFLLNFISNDTLSISYYQLQVMRKKILYARNKTLK